MVKKQIKVLTIIQKLIVKKGWFIFETKLKSLVLHKKSF